jgi:hypothetical protein
MVAQLVFLLINVVGVLTGFLYNYFTPDLYEHGKHGTIGYIITLLLSAWVFLTLVNTFPRNIFNKRYHDETNVSSSSHYEASGSESETLIADISDDEEHIQNSDGNASDGEKRGFLRGTIVDRFGRTMARFGRTIRALRLLHLVLERAALVLGFLGITSGAVIYTGIFVGPGLAVDTFCSGLTYRFQHGRHVFNGIAHFIKGGIFFWYGFLTLARWMGCFADMGWAWNRKPSRNLVGKVAFMPSAEFVESAVICFYGASNVFLEHLSNEDGKWAARDLEHLSITLMFFGGGLVSYALLYQPFFRGSIQA